MTNHERCDELISIYSLGALDENELKEIEEHIKGGCGVCEEMLKENEKVLSLIPYSIPSATPFQGLKRNSLKRSGQLNRLKKKRLLLLSGKDFILSG